MANSKPKRVYQTWKGRNKFLCNGRLVFGPMQSPAGTLLLILVPVVIFCTNVARNLVHEVSAYCRLCDSGGGNFAHSLCAAAAVSTSAQDPGIVPRIYIHQKKK
ncbi:protein S-acyltransferase 8-like [Pistacia vera]|uniref:protein S-acyltransferase 8-like n=1 Tax=Pistacia vera TaxID=55513 RepID=UPI001262E4EC|nr:protein S-acyltransferase 8-like [Pistacia vera]